jgi:type 1 glutamine amidotransferase
MTKVLLLGDYANAQWHPLRGVDEEIIRILDGFDVAVSEDYPYLKLEEMQEYGLIVNYMDAIDRRAGADFAGALLGYAAGGGAVLTLHNGIIAHSLPEVEQMIGASFTGHPQQEVIEYVYANAHPIMKAVDSFSIDEEPYQFEIDKLAGLNIIMEYIYKDKKYPAAWLRGFGKGKICYLSPGHNKNSFLNEGFGNLLRRSALWCAGEL